MYIKFNENLYKKIQELTITDYKIEGDMLPCESIVSIIQDLLYEYENLKEDFEDYKYQVEHPEDRPDYE